ncbi:MAG: GtrA family protein [Christensenella sp.]|nr:GtrA family protein [Christensenella sp.]
MIRKTLSNEIIRYSISGALIMLVNLGVYTGLLSLGMRYEIANIIALVLSRVAGFGLNKYFVFRSTVKGCFWREFWGFMVARGFSGLVDYFGLILLVDQFHIQKVLSKAIIMILVIVLNYILGKFFVFRRKEESDDSARQSENAQKYHSKNPLRQLLVQRLIDQIMLFVFEPSQEVASSDSPAPDVDILDAGCGEGFVVRQLHAYAPEQTIVGLDVSQSALEIAGKNNPDIRFLLGSVFALPFADASIGTVLLSEVLEHLENPAFALREAMRVASRSVVVSVPHEPWFRLGNLLTFRHVSRLGNPVGHIQHWTYRSFQTMILSQVHGTVRFCKSFPWSIAVIEKSTK